MRYEKHFLIRGFWAVDSALQCHYQLMLRCIWGFPKIRGTNNKDYSILGSKLGSPYFGKLPYRPMLSGGGSDEVCSDPAIAGRCFTPSPKLTRG